MAEEGYATTCQACPAALLCLAGKAVAPRVSVGACVVCGAKFLVILEGRPLHPPRPLSAECRARTYQHLCNECRC